MNLVTETPVFYHFHDYGAGSPRRRELRRQVVSDTTTTATAKL